MDEKRKFARVAKKIKSEVHTDDGMTFSSSGDMSKGGIFITTPEPLEIGSEVSLSLKLSNEKSVDIKGVVRWVKDDDGDHKCGMGIEFLEVKDGDISEINSVID